MTIARKARSKAGDIVVHPNYIRHVNLSHAKELEALGLDIRLYTHDDKEVELKEDIDDSTSFSNIENKSLHEENVVDENELSKVYDSLSFDLSDSEDDKLFDDLDDENDDIILDDDSSILEDEDFNDDDE